MFSSLFKQDNSAPLSARPNIGELTLVPDDILIQITLYLCANDQNMLGQVSVYLKFLVHFTRTDNYYFDILNNSTTTIGVTSLGHCYASPSNGSTALGILELYFSPQNNIEYIRQFIASLYPHTTSIFGNTNNNIPQIQKIIGYSGSEYYAQINLQTIKERITLRSISELLALLGECGIPLGVNFKQINHNNTVTYIDFENQIPANINNQIYFQIYYSDHVPAIIAKTLLINITNNTKAISVKPQRNLHSKIEHVLSIHLCELDLQKSTIRNNLLNAIKKILAKENLFAKVDNIYNTLVDKQLMQEESKQRCQIL